MKLKNIYLSNTKITQQFATTSMVCP